MESKESREVRQFGQPEGNEVATKTKPPDWNDRIGMENYARRRRSYNGKLAGVPKCNLPSVTREGELTLFAVRTTGDKPRRYVLRSSMDAQGFARVQEYPVVVLDPTLPTVRYYLTADPRTLHDGQRAYFSFTIGKNKAKNYYRQRHFVGSNAARIRQAFFAESP